jgi:cell wall-associated NlpC family hydrolase
MTPSLLRPALPRRLTGPRTNPVTRHLGALSLALLLGLGLALNPLASPRAPAAVSVATLGSVATVAAQQVGTPYRYGGTTPRTGFDCSGLTQYSYSRAGKRIPRTAQQQYAATTRISAAAARPGDLVFFLSGSQVYHVAVYAGAGYIWHAPKPGKRVAKVKLWTSAVRYGRVR